MKTLADATAFAVETILSGRKPKDPIAEALAALYRARDEPVSLEHHESPEEQILNHVREAIRILETTKETGNVPF